MAVVLLLVTAVSFSFGMLEPLLPLHLAREFNLDSRGIGMVFGAVSLANSAVMTPCLPLLARYSHREGRGTCGRNFALANAAFSVGLLLGPAVGGVVAQFFSFPAAAALCSAILLALGAGILRFPREAQAKRSS